MSPARLAAARVLVRLAEDERAFLTETLDAEIRRVELAPADARLATAICYGVLRNALLLDAQFRPFLKQSPSRLAVPVRALLRTAAYQKLLLQRIPDHAIANDTVEVAKRLRVHAREVGFLNAIVRQIVQLVAVQLPQKGTDSERLSVKYSHPVWMVDYLRRKFGLEVLELILAGNNSEADLTLRVNRLKVSAEDAVAQLERLGAIVTPGALSPDALIVSGVPVQSIVACDLFQRGEVYLQDEGSQVVGHLVSPQAGERVLDMCAAPGGKTTHLAELSGGRAEIVATDISDARLKFLSENMARLGTPGVEIAPLNDLMNSQGLRGSFDAVLVDAPCSGLGTLRRNPEIRYRITQTDLIELGKQQLEALNSAAEFVRAGGRLVYSTCTISDEENAEVVNAFLQANAAFRMAAAENTPPNITALRRTDGFYRTWPTHLNVDGFEAAVLRRS